MPPSNNFSIIHLGILPSCIYTKKQVFSLQELIQRAMTHDMPCREKYFLLKLRNEMTQYFLWSII